MADAQERIGQSIGNYRLLRLVGKGTFGTVYLAEHLYDHTSAAVKVLHIPLTSHDDFRAFLKEARTIRLRHPHIIPLLDFDLSRDDLPYIVMAYADGGTLRDRHPKGSKLSFQTIDTYVQQLASALQYAHNHHIIHRDVKPENMLVSNDGSIQLSDFGIAKISEHSSQSSLYQVAGTPAYNAPEQSRGKPCLASDQYALAIVVYEWLTGQRPFQGNHFAVIAQHRMDTPPPMQNIRSDVSIQIEPVIFKALAKAPEDRYPTITDFAQALHTALQEDKVPTQVLPNLDEPQSVPSTIAPVPLPDAPPLQMISSAVPLASAETPLPPQPAPTSLQNAITPDAEPVEILQSSKTVPNLEKRSSTGRYRRALIVFLCLVLLLSGGGTIWFIVTQQQQQQAHAAHSATATAAAAPFATATAAANAYWAGVAKNGVQFGFDAAHTNWNPYERDLNRANLTRVKQLWSFTAGNSISPAPATANGILYVSSHVYPTNATPVSDTLYAFDAACRSSCQPLWSFQAGGIIDSSPAVVNGMLYVSFHVYPTNATPDSETLYAFNANCRQSCQPLWSFQKQGVFNSSPVVANGMVYVSSHVNSYNVPSASGTFYAFDGACRSDCQPLWSFQAQGAINASPTVANGILYVGASVFSYNDPRSSSTLYAFDATCRTDCQPLGSFQVEGAIDSSPTVANDILYVGTSLNSGRPMGMLYAFDAKCHSSCQALWSSSQVGGFSSSLAIANGMIYVESYDMPETGTLYAFNTSCRSSCQPLWSFPIGGFRSSVVVANGVIYVGTGDVNNNGRLLAFDATCASDCLPFWSFTIGGNINPPIAIANGVIYVGSSYTSNGGPPGDGKLYALGLPAS